MMETGMLWFDNDTQADFASKVKRAATYYRNKYGAQPDICHVNPSMYSIKTVDGIEIAPDETISPNHFWIGVKKNPGKDQQ